MPHIRQDGQLIFTSSQQVLAHYSDLIELLVPQVPGITQEKYLTIRTELNELRRQLVEQLKNFSNSHVDDYFEEAMATAESSQEYYDLSNAYESLLMDEISRLKAKLYNLRTS